MRRRGWWNTFASKTASLWFYIFIRILLGWWIFPRKNRLYSKLGSHCQTDYTTASHMLWKEHKKYYFHINHVCFARRVLLQMWRSSTLTQIIFYPHEMSPPLQIRRKVDSFSKTCASFPHFVSLYLSSAPSIHLPDVTCRSRRMKRDIQFPAPSPSKDKRGISKLFFTLQADKNTIITRVCLCTLSAVHMCVHDSCFPFSPIRLAKQCWSCYTFI